MKKTGTLLSALLLSTSVLQAPVALADTITPTDQVTDSNSTTVATDEINNVVAEPDMTTTEKESESDEAVEPSSAPIPQATPAPASATVVESGVLGTSNWTLDSEGVLRFSAGEFPIYVRLQHLRMTSADYSDKITKIVFDGPVIASKFSEGLFNSLSKLQSIENIENLNTSNVESMRDMFSYTGLTSIDLSSWNTSKVKNMKDLFWRSDKLQSINITGIDTSNVENMEGAFAFTGLTSIDLSSWNTSKVKNMRELFWKSDKLKSINIAGIDSSNVENMEGTFAGLDIPTLDLSSLNTSKVTSMQGLFFDSKIGNLIINNLDTSNAKDFSYIFSATKIGNGDTLDMSIFDTSKVENMDGAFFQSDFKKLDLSSWDTSKVRQFEEVFFVMPNLEELNISSWDTSQVRDTKMGSMFNFNTTAGSKISLKKITLGPKFKFVIDPRFGYEITGLPEITIPGYSGKWQNIDHSKGGTVDDPKGEYVFTSRELEHEFNNINPTGPITFVWQKATDNPGNNGENKPVDKPDKPTDKPEVPSNPEDTVIPDRPTNPTTPSIPENVVTPEKPTLPETPVVNGKPEEPNRNTQETPKQTPVSDKKVSDKQLPQTGSKHELGLIALGFAAVASGLLVLVGLRKKKI